MEHSVLVDLSRQNWRKPSSEIVSLIELIKYKRDEISRTEGIQFDCKIINCLKSKKIILCGIGPELIESIVYWLHRTGYTIAAIVDNRRHGERIFRHRVLSLSELAADKSLSEIPMLNCASHDQQNYFEYKKYAEKFGRPILNHNELGYLSCRDGQRMIFTIDPAYYVESILKKGDRFLEMLTFLDDDVSKDVLLKVILGRLTINHDWFWDAYSPV